MLGTSLQVQSRDTRFAQLFTRVAEAALQAYQFPYAPAILTDRTITEAVPLQKVQQLRASLVETWCQYMGLKEKRATIGVLRALMTVQASVSPVAMQDVLAMAADTALLPEIDSILANNLHAFLAPNTPVQDLLLQAVSNCHVLNQLLRRLLQAPTACNQLLGHGWANARLNISFTAPVYQVLADVLADAKAKLFDAKPEVALCVTTTVSQVLFVVALASKQLSAEHMVPLLNSFGPLVPKSDAHATKMEIVLAAWFVRECMQESLSKSNVFMLTSTDMSLPWPSTVSSVPDAAIWCAKAGLNIDHVLSFLECTPAGSGADAIWQAYFLACLLEPMTRYQRMRITFDPSYADRGWDSVWTQVLALVPGAATGTEPRVSQFIRDVYATGTVPEDTPLTSDLTSAYLLTILWFLHEIGTMDTTSPQEYIQLIRALTALRAKGLFLTDFEVAWAAPALLMLDLLDDDLARTMSVFDNPNVGFPFQIQGWPILYMQRTLPCRIVEWASYGLLQALPLRIDRALAMLETFPASPAVEIDIQLRIGFYSGRTPHLHLVAEALLKKYPTFSDLSSLMTPVMPRTVRKAPVPDIATYVVHAIHDKAADTRAVSGYKFTPAEGDVCAFAALRPSPVFEEIVQSVLTDAATLQKMFSACRGSIGHTYFTEKVRDALAKDLHVVLLVEGPVSGLASGSPIKVVGFIFYETQSPVRVHIDLICVGQQGTQAASTGACLLSFLKYNRLPRHMPTLEISLDAVGSAIAFYNRHGFYPTAEETTLLPMVWYAERAVGDWDNRHAEARRRAQEEKRKAEAEIASSGPWFAVSVASVSSFFRRSAQAVARYFSA